MSHRLLLGCGVVRSSGVEGEVRSGRVAGLPTWRKRSDRDAEMMGAVGEPLLLCSTWDIHNRSALRLADLVELPL